MGYRTDVSVQIEYQGGVSNHFGGVLTSLKKVSRDRGYRSDSIAVSRDMGPLRRGCDKAFQ